MAYPFFPQNNFPQNNFPPQPQQVQNTGIIQAPNEIFVQNYPVGPGNCVMFKLEGQPIIMEKSMGFSQFEAPRIDVYRLVKEEQKEVIATDYKADLEAIWAEINALKEKSAPKKRKEVSADDAE